MNEKNITWLKNQLSHMNIKFKITDKRHGFSNTGSLTIVYVNRFVHDQSKYNKHGFALHYRMNL